MPSLFEARKQTAERRGHPVPNLERLKIIRELMMTLRVVTYAGQHHVMYRALEILRDDISRMDLSQTDPRAIRLASAVKDMEREAVQVVPRADTFSECANSVIELLSELWRELLPRDAPSSRA
ncbi:MAG: hypothetical protein QOI66_4663 [Myxococcales bacterium]|nr:hypothetical protein [Myxococcales bacterium]